MLAAVTIQLLDKLHSSFTFHSVLGGKLLAVVLEVQHDLCPLLNTTGLGDLKNPRAVGDDHDRERHIAVLISQLQGRIVPWAFALTRLRTTCIQGHQAQQSASTHPHRQPP